MACKEHLIKVMPCREQRKRLMKRRLLLVGLSGVLLSACTPTWTIPPTLGDQKNAPPYGYTPLDPLPVAVQATGTLTNARLLKALPDDTMRLAIGQFDGNANISYGPAKVGVAGNTYVVVIDYIKSDTRSFGVKVTALPNQSRQIALASGPDATSVVPVYIGVGLRLTATLFVVSGSVELTNLFAIGAAAAAKQVSGTLTIQTLGVSGEGISTIIPIPTEISASSIQNAIQSLGSIKAKLYDDKTSITPQVVGVYNTIGGGAETINGFISSLLTQPLVLRVP